MGALFVVVAAAQSADVKNSESFIEDAFSFVQRAQQFPQFTFRWALHLSDNHTWIVGMRVCNRAGTTALNLVASFALKLTK